MWVTAVFDQSFNSSYYMLCFIITLRVVWAAGLVGKVVGLCKLTEFLCSILWTIISDQYIRDAMS